MNDIDRLFQDSFAAHHQRLVQAPSRCRLRASTRVRRFSNAVTTHIQSKTHGSRVGLISLADRILEGMHVQSAEDANGDFLLNDILQTINEFHNGQEPFTLRMDQHMMVSHIITSCLPLIYGDKLEANRKRILKMLGTHDINESLLIVASRRVGKTTCIAVVAAALLICKPSFQCSVFAMVLKAAHRVMDAIKDFLNMHPRGRNLIRERNNALSLVLLEEDHPTRKKTLEVYPATTNMASEDEVSDLTRCIATLNLDHTTRAKEVSTQAKLCAGVIKTLEKFDVTPDIISMVEVSGKTWVRTFESTTRYDGVQTPNSYCRGGSNYIAWDREMFTCDTHLISKTGRYCGVILEETTKTSPQKIFHLAVHLPTKGNWEKQARLVVKAVEWGRLQGVDSVSIAGDFNKRPEYVMDIFNEIDVGLQPALTSDDDVVTTKKGNCIDNVLVESSAILDTVYIQAGNAMFSHHPVSVVARYEK